MAKLNEQGLNTFIRELDKHINTKINKLDASKITVSNGATVEDNIIALQSELGTNKSILEANINAIREVL